MRILRLLTCLTLIAGFVSCKKESSNTTPTEDGIDQFAELRAPAGFRFEAFKEVQLDLTVDNPGFSHPFLIEVYDYRPTAGGDLLYSGYTQNDQLIASISVPSSTKELYVVKKTPTGSTSMEVMEVTGSTMSHKSGRKGGVKKTTPVSPNCNASCDQSFHDQNGNFNINSNDPSGVYCFTGNTTASINVNRSDVTIRLCGTVDMQNLNLGSNCTLEIVDAATVTIKNLSLNNGSDMIIFDADVTIENNFSPNGTLSNYGNLAIIKSFNINNASSITNNATIAVGEHLNNNAVLINNSEITVAGNFHINGTSSADNFCLIEVDQELVINGTLNNHSYIVVNGDVKINGGSAFTQHSGAMLYSKADGHINSMANGQGGASLLKWDGNVNINGGAGLLGNLELCAGGSLSNNGSISAPATIVCGQVYIPTSACNPVGNGTPSVVDSDQDGVADENDNYPNDPLRAGDSYYPGSNTFASFAFEDLWPAMGDYDFNDLVVDYRYHLVTNANNDVMDIDVDYSVRATGAGLKNGFGLQLDVPANAVAQVTRSTALDAGLVSENGNGTEANQAKAVVMFFTNTRDELPNPGTPMVNTQPGAAYQQPDTSNVFISFNSAQSTQQLGSAPYNPFIFIDQDRGKELHLSGKEPTDLADASFFGKTSDRTDAGSGRYYVNENNLPWALNIPKAFDYPAEKTDIIDAYQLFVPWAQSGGGSNPDWYENLPGHRDQSLIYNPQQ